MKTEHTHIWFHRETSTFYQIPETVFFLPGNYLLERFDGVKKEVQPEELRNYEVAQTRAEQHLKEAYEEAMKVAKTNLKYLAHFAELTGRTKQFDTMIGDSVIPNGVSNVQEFVQDFFSKMNQPSSSEAEQQQLFQETFRKVPEIAAFFDEKALEKAAQNPEKWAKEMYDKMFGEELSERQKQKTDALKNTIAEQLRRNVEEAERQQKKQN